MLARTALGKLALPLLLSVLVTACMGSPESRLGETDLPAEGPMGLVGLAPPGEPSAAEDTALEAYGNMPLSFIPNRGQIDSQAAFYAQGAGYGMYFTPRSAILSFTEGGSTDQTLPAAPTSGVNLALEFVGSSRQVRLGAEEPGEGTVNYFQGNDPSDWQADLPTFGEVMYQDLWPGIDLAFRGTGGELKYEFVLEPGAQVEDIGLRYAGADGVSLKANGALAIRTALGTLTDSSPVTYQETDGQRVPVQSSFVLRGGGTYEFDVGAYDPGNRLVIDPGLAYSTYLGGGGGDAGTGIAVDASGNAYVTGATSSTDFPTTLGAFDTTANGGSDAFVTKLDGAGTAPLYSTYLGGGVTDVAFGVAVDGSGNAYVMGRTNSTDFPTTLGAFDTTMSGSSDAFVTKLNSVGSFDPASAPPPHSYSTYLGGSNFDEGRGIAVDGAGSAYVTGSTTSTNFPTTLGAFDTTANNNGDAFVTKLNGTGTAPLYSTYLGGGSGEIGSGVAVDGAGNAYVTGATSSTNFPTTLGAFDTTMNSSIDAFVTKLDGLGTAPMYSTYLGGGHQDNGLGVAVDGTGSAYVTGNTESADFPTTLGAFDPTANGSLDAFVTRLDAAGTVPLYSTYLGGGNSDEGFGVTVDGAGGAYVTGQTTSTDFPTTPGAFDAAANAFEAFVTKIEAVIAAVPADLSLAKADSPDPVKVGGVLTYTIEVSNAGPGPATDVSVEDQLPASTDFQSATASQGTCTHAAGTVTCNLGSIANGGTATVTIEVEARSTGTITNSATVSAVEPDLNESNNTDSEATEVKGAAACDTPGGGHAKPCN